MWTGGGEKVREDWESREAKLCIRYNIRENNNSQRISRNIFNKI